MNLVNFTTYHSILPLQIIKPISDLVVNYEDNFEFPNRKAEDGAIILDFVYPITMTEHVQYPEPFVGGVARFGGFLSALQGLMFVILSWINKREFEKKVTEFLRQQKARPEGLLESSAPDSSSSAPEIERRKTFLSENEDSIFKEALLNETTTLSKHGLPAPDKEDIKKRYSIEMFEDLLQTVV
jgi:hypothetical protein